MNRAVEPPFEVTIEVRDACLCLHAQRAARAIARRFDLALKPVGITSGQFSLLMSLNRPQPPQLGSVAALLAMDRTTLTANLKPLERAGLQQLVSCHDLSVRWRDAAARRLATGRIEDWSARLYGQAPEGLRT